MIQFGARRTYLPILLVFCTSLSGCGLFGQAPASPPTPLPPVRQFMVSHTPGSPDAVGTISDPEFGDNLRIVLEQEFLSASGETCRRASLFSPHGDAEVVIMCRDGAGAWTMAPRVWGQGLPPTAKAAQSTPAASSTKHTEKTTEKAIPQSTDPEKTAPEKTESPTPDKGADTHTTS